MTEETIMRDGSHADKGYLQVVPVGCCPYCGIPVTSYPWPEDAKEKGIGEIVLAECKRCGWVYRI